VRGEVSEVAGALIDILIATVGIVGIIMVASGVTLLTSWIYSKWKGN
jgi:hypothetical protein